MGPTPSYTPSRPAADDYKAAADVLIKVRPFITRISSSGYIEEMAKGSLCAVMGYSGDINIARQRAIDNKTGQDIQALIPATGATLFFDTMAIPKDAKHPDNAHKWINFIMKPEVHASLTNSVFYANPNKESMKFVAPALANDKAVFPDAAGLASMIPPPVHDQATKKLVTRTFTNFKANR
mgnify:CR=1 FL=1